MTTMVAPAACPRTTRRPVHPDPGPVRTVAGQRDTTAGARELSPRRYLVLQLLDTDVRVFPLCGGLAPSGTTTLSVTGVAPNGALDLGVTTSAVTTVNEVPPPPSTTTFTCQAAPTTVTLRTLAIPLPATAPGPPAPPTRRPIPPDPPQPVTGPLASATSRVGSNDFAIPAFIPSPSGSPCSPFLAVSLNTYAGGWIPSSTTRTRALLLNGGTNPIVAQPGWAQFTATTTVVSLGLPVGPPAGFSF